MQGIAAGELLHYNSITLNVGSSKRHCKLNMGGLNAIELFAGVGGFRLGLERAGHKVIWANEWDKWACDTYDKNFPGHIVRGDIRAIDAADIPAHDLIVGGFPCQAFSVAGKREGFLDTRGTLFFEIARIAAHHRTPYLLLENVKGLLSHDQGRTFGAILEVLDDLGYDCQWQVLNSKDFGVPQNRERVIIVGHLRNRPRPEVFPIARADGEPIRQVNSGVSQDHRIYDPSGVSPTLNTAAHAGGANVPKIGVINRGEFKDTGENALTITATYHKGHDNHGQRPMVATGINVGQSIRRLTPIECERLQGFPDNWTAGVSDTQRYKQMGNAVTVNVIEAVSRLLPKGA